MSECAQGRPVDFMGFHTDDMQPQGPMVYHGSKCLGPACTAEKLITDTERLDWLFTNDSEMCSEILQAMNFGTYECLNDGRIKLREDIDAAIRAEKGSR